MMLLVEPACPAGCGDCERGCALALIKLAWWRAEQERLLRDRPPLASSRRPGWRGDFAEAEAAIRRLTRDIRPCAPAVREGHRERRERRPPILVWSADVPTDLLPLPKKIPGSTIPRLRGRA